MKLTKIQLGGLLALLPLLLLFGHRLLFSEATPSDSLPLYQPPVKKLKMEQKPRAELNREEMSSQKALRKKESIRTQEEIAMSWGEIIEEGEKEGIEMKNEKEEKEEPNYPEPQKEPAQRISTSIALSPSNSLVPFQGSVQQKEAPEETPMVRQTSSLQQKLENSSLLAKGKYNFVLKGKKREPATRVQSLAEKEARERVKKEFYEGAIYGAHEISEGEIIRLELKEGLYHKDIALPRGSILQGVSSYYGGRLRVDIRTVKTPQGLRNISLTLHDGTDYQEGISYQVNEQINRLKDNLIDQGVSRIPVVGGLAQTVRNARASSNSLTPKFKLDPGLRVYIKLQ